MDLESMVLMKDESRINGIDEAGSRINDIDEGWI